MAIKEARINRSDCSQDEARPSFLSWLVASTGWIIGL